MFCPKPVSKPSLQSELEKDYPMSKTVLILCTGNSCRSQMAEVIWQQLIADGVGGTAWTNARIHSAGSQPAGFVHPLAIKALAELGLETAGLRSKPMAEFEDESIDLVVTVCGHAGDAVAKSACPLFKGDAKVLRWPFPDPADASGSEAEQLKIFRSVRDNIQQQIQRYLESENGRSRPTPRIEFSSETMADANALIKLALIEDIGADNLEAGVDCTTDAIVPADATARAAFVSRAAGVVCGVEITKLAIAQWAPRLTLEVMRQDGDSVAPQETIAVMAGPAHDILTMERTCLNFMCRLSGISSLTQQYVERIAGASASVLDTRKTTPGWRRLEKYAVACGGGTNHRMGLYDAIMLKDNHLAFYRSLVEDNEDTIPTAISACRKWIEDHAATLPNGESTILQLEVDTLSQLEIALGTDCDIILLDNMSCDELAQAVAMRNAAVGKQGKLILLEASGGVNLDTIGSIARTGVERISVGALTHSAKNFDIGLDWEITQ